jgi:hypothetical protein
MPPIVDTRVGRGPAGNGSQGAPRKATAGPSDHDFMGPDGNLYVLEAMDLQIVVVDPMGQFVGRIGRRGAGPGENLAALHPLAKDIDGLLH